MGQRDGDERCFHEFLMINATRVMGSLVGTGGVSSRHGTLAYATRDQHRQPAEVRTHAKLLKMIPADV